jgi:hypothetical protein
MPSRYYVEPLNDHTNEVFAQTLDEESAGLFKAEHGKTVKAYECSVDEREFFRDSKRGSYLEFRIWHTSGGILRRWYPKREPAYGCLRLVSAT